MANPHNLQVGQKLWYVPSNRYREAGYVAITKVGRKWITLDDSHNTRIHPDTLIEDSQFGAPDQCYLSHESYEAERVLSRALDDFKVAVARLYCRYITLAQIEQARKILGLEEKENK